MQQSGCKIKNQKKNATNYFIMKKIHPIRSLLGLTQLDIAMLLGISRSRWSVFEIGKRDLPLGAKQRLAELLMHANKMPQTAKQQPTQMPALHPDLQQHIKRLLRENEHLQMMVLTNINKVRKKQETQARLSICSEILQSRIASAKTENVLERGVAYKTANVLACDHSLQLATLELRMELLQREMAFLESKMKALEHTQEGPKIDFLEA